MLQLLLTFGLFAGAMASLSFDVNGVIFDVTDPHFRHVFLANGAYLNETTRRCAGNQPIVRFHLDPEYLPVTLYRVQLSLEVDKIADKQEIEMLVEDLLERVARETGIRMKYMDEPSDLVQSIPIRFAADGGARISNHEALWLSGHQNWAVYANEHEELLMNLFASVYPSLLRAFHRQFRHVLGVGHYRETIHEDTPISIMNRRGVATATQHAIDVEVLHTLLCRENLNFHVR
jgi:hypothetical protein